MSLYHPSEPLVLKLTEWAVRYVEADDTDNAIYQLQGTVERRVKAEPVETDRRSVISLVHLASRYVQLEDDDDHSGNCA